MRALLSVALACCAISASRGQDTKVELDVLSVAPLNGAGEHCAFTDLIRHRGRFVCVFREGSAHVPGTDGVIAVLTSEDGVRWARSATIERAGVDLRDPKLCEHPDGRLMLLAGGSHYGGRSGDRDRPFEDFENLVFFSNDARGWTEPSILEIPGQWLWRLTWVNGVGYGFAYPVTNASRDATITLWKTQDGVRFARVTAIEPPDAAKLNETTIRVLGDGTMLALSRSDALPSRAFLGRSAAPYEDWEWRDLGRPIQGPNFLVLPGGALVYAGRDFPEGKDRTVVGVLSGERAHPLLELPSAGDTSYPGMVWDDGVLWVSYYSAHEGARAQVFLAKLGVRGVEGR